MADISRLETSGKDGGYSSSVVESRRVRKFIDRVDWNEVAKWYKAVDRM